MDKATIIDVAKKAGVSIATVSNVLNNKATKFNPVTKEKILAIVEELNYQPDFTARSLVKKKSNLLGIILPITHAGDSFGFLLRDNPFYAELISGIDSEVRNNNYDILITGLSKDQNCLDWIRKRNLEGIIFVGLIPEQIKEPLKKMNIPVVIVDSDQKKEPFFYSIRIDDQKGAYLAVKHLIELGHQKIAFATGKIADSFMNYNRLAGYQKALHEHQIPFLPRFVFENTTSFSGGYQIAEKMIACFCQASAVFATADILALGMMKCFTAQKIKIPRHLSIIGFDDIQLCRFAQPELTTIRQDSFQKGKIAARLILDHIAGHEIKNREIILDLELVIRQSTAGI